MPNRPTQIIKPHQWATPTPRLGITISLPSRRHPTRPTRTAKLVISSQAIVPSQTV
jgi:hypothetical protein